MCVEFARLVLFIFLCSYVGGCVVGVFPCLCWGLWVCVCVGGVWMFVRDVCVFGSGEGVRMGVARRGKGFYGCFRKLNWCVSVFGVSQQLCKDSWGYFNGCVGIAGC